MTSRWPGNLNLLACCIVAALGGLAYLTMPAGSLVRVALSAAVLFFIPGYLLIEACAGPAAKLRTAIIRAGLAIGISPAIVGLLALATSLAPHGFRAGAIVATITFASFLLAGVAAWRRSTTQRAPQIQSGRTPA